MGRKDNTNGIYQKTTQSYIAFINTIYNHIPKEQKTQNLQNFYNDVLSSITNRNWENCARWTQNFLYEASQIRKLKTNNNVYSELLDFGNYFNQSNNIVSIDPPFDKNSINLENEYNILSDRINTKYNESLIGLINENFQQIK